MEYLDKLGVYFVYHNVRERFGLTFESFVDLVERDVWKEYIS